MSNELGEFLRARRADAALEPTSGTTGRRRITGLRREEVAAFAGISVDYVTRLEQGRETNPSNAVLDALARVLRLGPDAVDHLYALRGKDSAGGRPRPRQGAAIATRMDDLVEAVRPHPAYVLDRLSTMVAGNDEGLTLFAGIAELPAEERNTCRYLLTHPRAQEVFLDWEDVARGAVAHLRAANAHDLDDEELQRLVSELREESSHFAEWWAGHLVERRRSATQRIQTAAGVRTHRYEVLHLPEEQLRMTLWLPADPD